MSIPAFLAVVYHFVVAYNQQMAIAVLSGCSKPSTVALNDSQLLVTAESKNSTVTQRIKSPFIVRIMLTVGYM